MKNILFLLFILISFSTFSQDAMYAEAHKPEKKTPKAYQYGFVLTPKGFINLHNTSQDFVVLEVDGNTQSELYQKVLLFLHTTYNSPKDVISQVEPISITINGWSGKAIRRNGMHVFDMGYSINFQFKDNKIRVSAPTFDLTTFTDKSQRLELVANNSFTGSILGIYNTKGTLKSDHAKRDLEIFFNEFLLALNSYFIESSEAW